MPPNVFGFRFLPVYDSLWQVSWCTWGLAQAPSFSELYLSKAWFSWLHAPMTPCLRLRTDHLGTLCPPFWGIKNPYRRIVYSFSTSCSTSLPCTYYMDTLIHSITHIPMEDSTLHPALVGGRYRMSWRLRYDPAFEEFTSRGKCLVHS